MINATASDLVRVQNYIHNHSVVLKEEELISRIKRVWRKLAHRTHLRKIGISAKEYFQQKLLRIVRIGASLNLERNPGTFFTEWPLIKKEEEIYKVVPVTAAECLEAEMLQDEKALESDDWIEIESHQKKMQDLRYWNRIAVVRELEDGSVLCAYDDIELLSGTGGYIIYKAGSVLRYRITSWS